MHWMTGRKIRINRARTSWKVSFRTRVTRFLFGSPREAGASPLLDGFHARADHDRGLVDPRCAVA